MHEVPGFPNTEKVEDQQALQNAINSALQDNLCCEFCRDTSSRQQQALAIKVLVKAGGNFSEHSIWYALNPLCATGHPEIAREFGVFMVEQGVNISVTNERGITPLAAAVGDHVDDGSLVSALLASGASISLDSDSSMPHITPINQVS